MRLLMNPIITIVSFFFSISAYANTYFCEDTASNKLDRFGTNYENNKESGFKTQTWIIDTGQGWRRSDVANYRGSCEVNKGYTVCKASTIFGEATFSIHPDDSNFILVYLDYGIDVLVFVGTCTKT